MPRPHIPHALRQSVSERAKGRCEYCLIHEDDRPESRQRARPLPLPKKLINPSILFIRYYKNVYNRGRRGLRMKRQTSDIVQYILEKVSVYPQNIVTVTAEKFGISRPAVLRHIKNLANRGLIVVHGKTRDRHYTLKPLAEHSLDLPITQHLQEDEIWRQHIGRCSIMCPRM